nr:hypothetical protein [Tanacetum cinerariifolium]
NEVQAIVAEKPKVQKKRRTVDGASGSNHTPKKLREDHGTSGHVGASTGEKSLAAIQELFEQSTLNVETQRLSERFVISSDSSHNSSANVVDDEVTSIVSSGVGVELVPHSILGTLFLLVPLKQMLLVLLNLLIYVPKWNVINNSAFMTQRVSVTATTTALPTTYIQANTVATISMDDGEVLGAGSSFKVPLLQKLCLRRKN